MTVLLISLLFSFNTYAQSSKNIATFLEQWRHENQIPAVALAIKIANKNPTYYLKGLLH